MKISFNTTKTSTAELITILDIINEIVDARLAPKVDELKDSSISAGDYVKVYSTLDEVKQDFGEPTSEEYEPDEGESGSPGDLVVPVVPMPEYEPSYCIPFPPPPVAAIAQVLPLPSQPATTLTVIPPPPPQESQSVSTGTNEGMISAMSRGETVSTLPSDDLDSDGTPWDATVHSESRAKNVDGTWRKRRVNKNVEVKAAIAGLEAITPNSVPAPPTRKMMRTFVRIDGGQNLIEAPEGATDDELSAITGKSTMREDRYQAMISGEPAIPVAPAAPSVPPPPPAAPPVIKTAAPSAPAGTWPELMERVTKYFGAQKITSVDLAEICKTFNIGSVQECFTQPHLIPSVSSAIDAKAATKAGG